MTADADAHVPVLLEEVLAALAPVANGSYVDCTFGRGGHTKALLARLDESGRVLALDRDPEAVSAGRALAAKDARLTMERASFSSLKRLLEARGRYGRVDGVLFDLGVSSPQLDDPARGFSFALEGPLDMRMDPGSGVSAAVWVNGAPEREIADVLFRFADERHSRRIARAICAARREAPIETTARLAAIIARANPSRERGRHPATRSFQAIRIFVNRELDELDAGLDQAVDALRAGGRLAVISFHSLEDRRVKRFIRDQGRGPQLPPDLPVVPAEHAPRLRAVGRAVHPGEAEVARNPRARSAVLRVAERCP